MNKKSMLNMFSYILTAVLLIIIFFFFIKKEQIELISRIGVLSFSAFLFFSLINYVINGLQYVFMRKRYNINLEKKDILFLPLSMTLWGCIIPFQGSLAFLTLFLKHKHSVKVVESFSITIFLYLISAFLGGIIGIIFIICYNITSPVFILISVLFLLNPLFIIIGYRLSLAVPDIKIKIIMKIFHFTRTMIYNMKELWMDYKNTAILIMLYIIRIICNILWYSLIAKAFGYQNVNIFALILLTLWMNLSLIFKFTPNNLGIAQIFSGILFSLINLSPEQGIMISLVATLSSTALALTLGVMANFYYFRRWSIAKRNSAAESN